MGIGASKCMIFSKPQPIIYMEVAYIEPYNSKIEKKIVKIGSESYQVEAGRRELKGLEQGSSHTERSCMQEQLGYKEGNNSEYDEQAQTLEVEMVKVGPHGEEPLTMASNAESSGGASSLVALPEQGCKTEIGDTCDVNFDRVSVCASSTLTSTIGAEDRKDIDPTASSASLIMGDDSSLDRSVDVVFHLSRKAKEMFLARTLRLSHSYYESIMQGAIGESYNSRTMT
ncbi:hypothetical protein Cgig2_030956 [Carnegiea gigantea]|uniref:Uncharacterized protein n=1 Tax=Carnegiea gigantea TaxID=171969 RepID=A0A9Q1K424_9CARY|nr:hypothetical protein Cgig2_030956 [Carnegiea gigantea]